MSLQLPAGALFLRVPFGLPAACFRTVFGNASGLAYLLLQLGETGQDAVEPGGYWTARR